MNIAIYGTGRAAGALGVAFSRTGHTIVGVHGRSPESVAVFEDLFSIGQGTPDLRVIAVSDDAIAEVAQAIAAHDDPVPTVHVSGAASVDTLRSVAATGGEVGAFHPLQTMPDPLNGADRLPGSWIAITASDSLRETLVDLAESIGCRSFFVTDDAKPLYHAAAAAAANFTLAVLSLASDLFEEAGVPFEAAGPLVEAIVENAFARGPVDALTGPIARGDVETVRSQIAAVAAMDPSRLDDFIALSAMTARTVGNSDLFAGMFE